MLTRQRNALLPWWIGLAILIPAVVYIGYQFTSLAAQCGPVGAGLLAFAVLGVIPAVYLALMYLTLKDQARSERE
jgi:membrane protein DedA with SNARE-associated domain